MHNKLFCIILSICFIHTTNAQKKSYLDHVTQKNVVLAIIASGAIIYAGKQLYDHYIHYIWPNKSLIRYYHHLFLTIHESLDTHTILTNDVLLNDQQLKEKISTNNNAYPFMHYYNHVDHTLYKLKTDIKNVQKSLNCIHLRKNYLTHSKQSSVTVINILNQLEQDGIQLKKQLKNISMILSKLKKRLSLFQEYQEDCMSWHQKQEKENNHTIHEESYLESLPSEKPAPQSDTKDSFGHLEEQIIHFNMNYY